MVLSKPELRVGLLLAVAMFLSGVTAASTYPYSSVVAVEFLGMSGPLYSVVIAVSSIVGATLSGIFGYFSDRLRDRRLLALFSAFSGCVGYGLIYVFRNTTAFTVATCLITPAAMSLFSQNFAYARAYYQMSGSERADLAVSMLRSVFATAWIVVPPLAGYLAAVASPFDVYLLTAVAYVACGAVIVFMMRDRATAVPPPKASAQQAAEQRTAPIPVVFGLFGILLMTVAMRLVGTAMPLVIVAEMGGSVGDVGLYAGLAAACEVPFMILWAYLGLRIPRTIIIFANGLLLCLYLVVASGLTSVQALLWLQPLNGLAMAALLTTTISYTQDAIKGRVGLSSSLIDILGVAASLLGAVIFGVVSAIAQYRVAITISGAVAALGGLAVLLTEYGPAILRRPPDIPDPGNVDER